MKTFPELTRVDAKKKVYTWNIRVEDKGNHSVIYTEYGYTKKVINKQFIHSGKNIGKKNETTHYTQAILEAQSKWNKKHDLFTTNLILPMLANEYDIKKVSFPLYTQPKLDGYRMLYDSTKQQLYTRNGTIMDCNLFVDICKDLQSIPNGYILDGEFYSNELSFEELGIIRKKTLTDSQQKIIKKVKYYIYDIITKDNFVKLPFEKRHNILDKFIFIKEYSYLRLLQTHIVNSEKELIDIHKNFISKGFEGTILRNKGGVYRVNLRSNDLLKYKDFKDAEFEIVDFTFESSPTGLPLVIWIVKVNKHLCNVRPKGGVEERNMLYKKCQEDFSKYKNKQLWIKFFEYTEDSNLRFPTTKTDSVTSYIRDEII